MKRKEFCVRFVMPTLVLALVTAGGCAGQEPAKDADKEIVTLDPAGSGETDAEAGQEAETETETESSVAPKEDAGGNADPAAEQEGDGSSETKAEENSGRKDGERFEDTIILEGMEETVRYEHIINPDLGFAMDYDYEIYARHSGSDGERFVSIYDDVNDPMDYFEVSCSKDDAKTAAAAIEEELSKEYTIRKGPFQLENAGDCIKIDASETKEGSTMPDYIQTVYIIPAGDGCRIARAHYVIEAAEGLGSRFAYMMHTFEVIEK
ncbi:MAG: hypothetical protein K6E50_07180 [Lachnospiraceae bacterium]|nr:hypothetical protein [Lachnospiraceae bacterium]